MNIYWVSIMYQVFSDILAPIILSNLILQISNAPGLLCRMACYSFTSNPLLVQSNESLGSISILPGNVKLEWRGGLQLKVFIALIEDLGLIRRHSHDGSQSSVTLLLGDSTLLFWISQSGPSTMA